MDVGLGSWVELSSNIKGGWESSTNGGNSTSVSNASISAIGRGSSSISTIDGGSGWSSSNGWGSSDCRCSSNSWGGSIGDCWGWGSSNANWAKGLTTTSSKVFSLSDSHSRLVIGGDSAIEVNLQSKRSCPKSLRTSIAASGNSRGSSDGWGSGDSWSWCNGVGSGGGSNGRGSNSSSCNNTSGIAESNWLNIGLSGRVDLARGIMDIRLSSR